jgi:3-hydroxyacyl-CoA dehydrogenase/enoyl-CoA hydratase/3-hydroxybutyryl-CoA epimerase
MLLLEEGARTEDVDRALLDWGFPVGPIAVTDEIGIDVASHVARDLGTAFAARGARISRGPAALVAAGFLGRKNGRGLYAYPPGGRKGRKQPDPAAYACFGGAPRRDFPAEELVDRLALLMIGEAVRCLEEGILASPGDGDTGAVFGLGFPPFRGGPFRHIDAFGAERIVRRMEQLAERHGPRFAPPGLLAETARRGGRFHGR